MASIYCSEQTAEGDEDYPDPINNLNPCDYHEPHHISKFINNSFDSDQSCKNSQSFFHLNCRGLSINWHNFYNLIVNMHSSNHSFDCIGLSEVWDCESDQRIKLPGYHNFIPCCRNGPKNKRGGVGLFIKEDIQFRIRYDLSVFIESVYESLFVELMPEGGKHRIVGVIYRPNSFPLADIDVFTTTFLEVLDLINNENKKSIVMGDMNLDLLNPIQGRGGLNQPRAISFGYKMKNMTAIPLIFFYFS